MDYTQLDKILQDALVEDTGNGDHSSLAVIPETAKGSAVLYAKDSGVLAGIQVINRLFELADHRLQSEIRMEDGDRVAPGNEVLVLAGPSQVILGVERLALNIVQRMSGIATLTRRYVEKIQGTPAKILDTRKTTPNFRLLEKEAVRIGGGENHRMGLYDMILLKDNHIDFAGGISQAIHLTNQYLTDHRLNLQIEIEVRDFNELAEVLTVGGINRIMLDNFSPMDTQKAVQLINKQYEIESSGGITLQNIRAYAETGVHYISVGALTHQINSLDFSLKAQL